MKLALYGLMTKLIMALIILKSSRAAGPGSVTIIPLPTLQYEKFRYGLMVLKIMVGIIQVM